MNQPMEKYYAIVCTNQLSVIVMRINLNLKISDNEFQQGLY